MDPPPITLFVPQYRVNECLDALRGCLEQGWTGWGARCVDFEAAWRSYSGFANAHFLNSATAGLHLAVRIFKRVDHWRDGDEIICTALTFPSSNHAVLHENLTPVFADVDEYLCLDPDSIRERISPRTRAVCFVGIGGNPGRYRDVRKLCDEHGLRLILDAAHMSGTWIGDRHAGVEADAAVFSFHAVKNLPTGDSGMLCFYSDELDHEARKLSWLGIDRDTYSRTSDDGRYRWMYDVEHVGFKYQGNSVMAALGLVGLRYLEADNQYRRRLAAWYDERLLNVTGLDLVPIPTNVTPSRHLYQVLVDHRENVLAQMNEDKIFPGVHYRDNTEYPMYASAAGTCPKASLASRRVISLPLHLRLTQHDVDRVATSLLRSTGIHGT